MGIVYIEAKIDLPMVLEFKKNGPTFQPLSEYSLVQVPADVPAQQQESMDTEEAPAEMTPEIQQKVGYFCSCLHDESFHTLDIKYMSLHA